MNHTKTTIHDGLYDFIRDAKVAKKRAADSADENRRNRFTRLSVSSKHPSTPIDGADLYARLSPVIPKVYFPLIIDAFVT